MTMPRRPLGEGGLSVPVVGWSTGALARPSNLATPADLVRAVLDAGIDLFDSAPDDDAQDTLARTLRGGREHVLLGARCVAGGGASAWSPPGREWRPEEVRRRLEASLRRLRTDWVDLWLLDRPSPEAVTDDDLWAQLADDRQAGWIRAVGVVLDGEAESRAPLERGAVDALVLRLDLSEAEPGRTLAAEVAERKVAVLVDDPLAGDVPPHLLRGLTDPDAERSGAQARLAALLSLAGVSSVLSRGATPEEVAAHAAAADMPLSEADTRMLAARLDEARESRREP